jgi:hypothetical protein
MLTMKDTALLAEAKSQNLDISPTDGDYIQGTARRLQDLPREVIEMARDAIKAN